MYIVELGGKRVLHMGDATVAMTTCARFASTRSAIDVALVPTWVHGQASRQAIERWVKPRQVVAFHVGEGGGTARRVEVRAGDAGCDHAHAGA